MPNLENCVNMSVGYFKNVENLLTLSFVEFLSILKISSDNFGNTVVQICTFESFVKSKNFVAFGSCADFLKFKNYIELSAFEDFINFEHFLESGKFIT